MPSNMGSCAEQYGVMTADTRTHKHTHTHTHTHTHINKPPTAGVQLVVHTSINFSTTAAVKLLLKSFKYVMMGCRLIMMTITKQRFQFHTNNRVVMKDNDTLTMCMFTLIFIAEDAVLV